MSQKNKKSETKQEVKKDLSRQVEADPRDPRSSPEMWPCFSEHQPCKEMSNRWGVWQNCGRCGLRLIYVPKEGSPANSVQCINPGNMLKALKQLQETLPKNMEPNEELVRAMMEKVIAEERMSVLLKEYEKAWEKNKEKIQFAKAKVSAYPNVKEKEKDSKEGTLEHALSMLTEDEKLQILNLAQKRNLSKPQPIPVSDEDLASVVYGKNPVVWEMFCSPESQLTEQVNREGLQGHRINLANGFDLYKEKTLYGKHNYPR
ncbi:unnamed protein product, partial [Effrenium voratum]